METYLYDYKGESLYGKIMDVALLDFIRPEIAFDSVEELKARMDRDLKFMEEQIHQEEFTK